MKTLTVLILLPILAGFYAVLLAPAPALAAACPNNQSITADCDCGANKLTQGGGNYCDNGTMRTGSPTATKGETSTVTAPAGPQSGAELIALINNIGNWVFAGLLAVASLFLIYAGFMWITAGGDPQAATKARQMLTNALIGVVVALLARGLVQVIKSVVGG